MKRFLILCAVALTLGGCASLGSIGEKVLNLPAGVLTTSINNPVAPVNIYQAKAVYAATLELVVGYREYCWSKPYAALMADLVAKPICQNRRSIVRAMQAADNRAFAAIAYADNFIRNNPTLNAESALRAALSAVSDFQNIARGTAVAIVSK